jgi:DNA invertase Pin-like site-specific DNA recombinase
LRSRRDPPREGISYGQKTHSGILPARRRIAVRAQERRIRAFADEHGYGVEMAFYRDCGQSGVTLDRPAMNALTADIRAGKIGTVITAA